ncbi:LETM1 domain-containing protein 1-like [Biomphalaria glabrata]|uniref:LETM1 domain-containing protein 1-like n=1 Tax=Biomphalaria glabrata TaxID=6526 RepID=A0A9W2Z6M4_BIOGL|nr:LETM1 domain-containing protein 1-like [Biomphalaria glabrata]
MAAPIYEMIVKGHRSWKVVLTYTTCRSRLNSVCLAGPNIVCNWNIHYCTHQQKEKQVQEDKVQAPARPQRYLFDKLIQFITNSSGKLEKRIPSAFQVYRTFKSGISEFVSDSKDFYKVSTRLWSGESLQQFKRKELELYRQFSSDLPVVGLIFVIAFAPGGAIVFPLAYVFPRFLLSHHFWTPLQKEEFRKITLTKQLKHYDYILDHMHLLSQHIQDKESRDYVRSIINKLDTNVLLKKSEIQELLPLFEGKPFHTDCLSIRHLRHLAKALSLSLRHKKLIKDALFLHYIDTAMAREGTSSMTDEELNRACCWRGLNPSGLQRQEKIHYLENWMQISGIIHEKSISLLLHLPVLLSYGLPSNRALMPASTIVKRGKLDEY